MSQNIQKSFFRFRIKDNSHVYFVQYEEVTLEMLLLQCCMHGDMQCVYWQPQLFSVSECVSHTPEDRSVSLPSSGLRK